MSGGEMSSADRLGGLRVRSEDEDVELAAGRSATVRGERVNVVAERDIEMQGRSVSVLATGYNENVEVQTAGGALTVGMLGLAGSTMGSRDVMTGLRVGSAEDVELAAGAGRNVLVSGADVAITSERNTLVEADSIGLSADWNGDVSVKLAGGALSTGSMRV